MTKLIHTTLLREYNHFSPVGIATASHLDFCRFCYKHQKSEYYRNMKQYFKYYVNFFTNFVLIVSIPLIYVTKGVILYPFWMYVHHKAQRELIEKYSVDKLNRNAKNLVDEIENGSQTECL